MIGVAACRPSWTGPTGGRPPTGGPPNPSVIYSDAVARLA
jgi:hypothetical protein